MEETRNTSSSACGHRSGSFACTLTGPHSITGDGRVQHYYRKPVA